MLLAFWYVPGDFYSKSLIIGRCCQEVLVDDLADRYISFSVGIHAHYIAM